jgi:ketosteroid isomerase-like protein
MSTPDQVSRRLAERLAANDVESVVAMYEPDAVFADLGGTVRGYDAIHAAHQEFVDSGAVLHLHESVVIESGDLALVHWSWTVTRPDREPISGMSAEVLRRQPGGEWKYVIDNSDGSDLIAAWSA